MVHGAAVIQVLVLDLQKELKNGRSYYSERDWCGCLN